MNLSFVCINYNNSGFTRDAVASLQNRGETWNIIVVDNNSNIDDVNELKDLAAEHPNVHLILSKDNVGYFSGLNVGIRHLKSRGLDDGIIVIGNNDLEFPPDFSDCLRRNSVLFEKYPVVAPDIVTLDGDHQNPHVVSKISPFRELIYDVYYANYYLGKLVQKLAKMTKQVTDRRDEKQHAVAQEIYQGYGACYILSRVFFQHFEELWAPTFMVHEEFFLSKQINDQGFRVYYEPSIKVLHHVHSTTGLVAKRTAWETGREAHRVRRQYLRAFN